MKSTALWVIVAIIIIAAALCLATFLFRKNTKQRVKELEVKKQALLDLPVIEELDEVKNMHLIGQSQETYRATKDRWNAIVNTDFSDIESKLFEVENSIETFHLLHVKTAIQEVETKINDTESAISTLRNELNELKESETQNSLAIQASLDLFEDVNQKVEAKSETFGPALPEIKKRLAIVEDNFNEFNQLNTSGDPIEAREILTKAEHDTNDLAELCGQVPTLYEELAKVFPEQVQEITHGYYELISQDFMFLNDNVESDLEKLEKKIAATLLDLEKCEVATVAASNKEIATKIESLYEVMETEITAKAYVESNESEVLEYIEHAAKNNRQLVIELDHTSQSYALNNNELGTARGFQTQIEELQRNNEHYTELLNKKDVVFSEVANFYSNVYQILAEVEENQVQMEKFIYQMVEDEKDAQACVDKFEFKLRSMKRYIEKQRLPGVSEDYLEVFFKASDLVEELIRELNKIRVDVEIVNKLVKNCKTDIVELEVLTNEFVDNAALTEQMLQYANRYRHTHEEISDAIEQSLDLFNNQYDYAKSLEVIKTALEHTEPSAPARLEKFYYNSRTIQ